MGDHPLLREPPDAMLLAAERARAQPFVPGAEDVQWQGRLQTGTGSGTRGRVLGGGGTGSQSRLTGQRAPVIAFTDAKFDVIVASCRGPCGTALFCFCFILCAPRVWAWRRLIHRESGFATAATRACWSGGHPAIPTKGIQGTPDQQQRSMASIDGQDTRCAAQMQSRGRRGADFP